MKIKTQLILFLCSFILLCACGNKIGNSSLAPKKVTTTTVDDSTSIVIDESSLNDLDSSDSSFESSSKESSEESSEIEKTSKPICESSLINPETTVKEVEVIGPEPEVTVITTEYYGPVEEETTSQIEEEYIVYKPSTHYVHRSNCHWVDSSCYEITDTNDIEARKCSECNPDIEIINEYKPPVTTTAAAATSSSNWNGPVLSRSAGVVYGPSGKETYYNLNMSGVVSIMRGMGFDEANYPYWVDERQVKYLGPYIMCAANLDVHPRGTLVESSLGTAIVCDTGGFAYSNPNQLDIATAW